MMSDQDLFTWQNRMGEKGNNLTMSGEEVKEELETSHLLKTINKTD